LTAESPVAVEVELAEDGQIVCTVLGYDAPGALALIAGVLAAAGLSVRTGVVYTYRSAPAAAAASPRIHARIGGRAGRERARPVESSIGRDRLVDRFVGDLVAADGGSLQAWRDQVQAQLGDVFRAIDARDAGIGEARRIVSELVAGVIRRDLRRPPPLAPVQVQFAASKGEAPGATVLTIDSQDAPLFLYTFAAALALRGIAVLRVQLDTVAGRVHDSFTLVDRFQRQILDPEVLAQIEFSVVLTKRFAYFVGAAADSYAAMLRFERLAETLSPTPANFRLIEEPRVMRALAIVLGASEYLWEDFVRQDTPHALPLLAQLAGVQTAGAGAGAALGAAADESVGERLRGAVALADDPVAALNAFKDREIYLIDLRHLLGSLRDESALSESLSDLAEAVVAAAFELATDRLASKYGEPLTVGGIRAEVAVLGLGKLGGRALGYASDIELLFVYADAGKTSGPTRVSNDEYFVQLVDATARCIGAKRQGIFEVDLRLRPYGASGPRAVRLDTFTRYYSPAGEALAYERLALLRLRALAGSRELGLRVERLRDHLVYTGDLDLTGIQGTRAKQIATYASGAQENAKYSPGALVDVEYSVQVLQVRFGAADPRLRTPSVRAALRVMAASGVLAEAEAQYLVAGYSFFRRLINALRMLRGSARDLYLPAAGDAEYDHLARRMGYSDSDGPTPAQQLHIEFEMRRAEIAEFVAAQSGATLTSPVASLAEIVLAEPGAGDTAALRAMAALGMSDPPHALRNFRALAAAADDIVGFAQLAVVAGDMLAQQAAPQRALNNWERFVAALDQPDEAYRAWRERPTRLALLLGILATSQFLADHLAREPAVFDWISDARWLRRPLNAEEVRADLALEEAAAVGNADWLRRLRVWRRRHLLRIAMRDYCLHAPITEVVGELSLVADAAIAAAFQHAVDAAAVTEGFDAPLVRARACIVAFGKLGGRELNYSSDIDLLAIFGDAGLDADARRRLAGHVASVANSLRSTLAAHTSELFAYRVDWRLRPYGNSGELVHTFSGVLDYYVQAAGDWEVQALLKARAVVGADAVVARLESQLGAAFDRFTNMPADERQRRVFTFVRELRERGVPDTAAGGVDIKSGVGGIRDVEFLVQALQLGHLGEVPELRSGNTLEALGLLASAGILDAATTIALRDDYTFLRRVEHSLQIFDDRQVHVLPTTDEALLSLSRQLFGATADKKRLERELAGTMARVRGLFATTTASAGSYEV
jgi:glutamate-ammonia-ligase adenylyltransferase